MRPLTAVVLCVLLVSTSFAQTQNSFKEVTSHLDPGGDLYLYLNTEQWLKGLSDQIGQYQNFATSVPGQNAADQQNVRQFFDTLTRIIRNSGVEQVRGFGMSSIPREPGIYRNTTMLYHGKGNDSGYLWQIYGKTPHALDGADLLPANTAVAMFSDFDLPLLWSILNKEVGQSGIPGTKEALQGLPTQFAAMTGLDLDKALASLGNGWGLVISIKDGGSPLNPFLQIPDVGAMLVFKVKNDTMFNEVDASWRTNPAVIRTDRPGFKMRTLAQPGPAPVTMRPSVAQSGEYFFFSSSDSLIEEALAVKAGTRQGLKAEDEFKKLVQNLPEQGNGFTFISRKFSETILRFAQLNQGAAPGGNDAQAQMLMSMFGPKTTPGSYRVVTNSDDGLISVGNGGQSGASLVLLPYVTVPLIVASVAIPSLLRSREAANESSAVANLRTIVTAETAYSGSTRGYADMPALIRSGRLDSRFNAPISGYQFTITVSAGNYRATATPVSANTGRYSYFANADGIVRYAIAPALSPPGLSGKPVR